MTGDFCPCALASDWDNTADQKNRTKKSDLPNFLKLSIFGVCCLQEILLNNINRFFVREYVTFCHYRPTGLKSGVLIHADNTMVAVEITLLETRNWASVTFSDVPVTKSVALSNKQQPFQNDISFVGVFSGHSQAGDNVR